jgi:polysaccharide export outer membrane protein
MNKGFIFFALLLLIFASSCNTYKTIPYYQDLDHTATVQEEVENYSPITIQSADILGINVSSRSPESSAIFANVNVGPVTADGPIAGYLVDPQGDIHLPVVGVMKVKGFTTAKIADTLTKMLLTYYKDPVVNVRLLNFRVSISGDVQRPNTYTLQNERTTITQALSLAGDLNITAMRKNITLIREENGKRKFIPIDLTSKKIFESPYFYLKNNDEIYVQSDRTKYATVDRGYRNATLIVSGISIIAIVLSTIYR